MQTVTPISNPEAIVCVCGNSMASHRCPSSQGYAPRALKVDTCPACGLKQHQNLEGSTVRLECIWRQWAEATGQLVVKVGKTVRYAMPPVNTANIMAMAAWLSSGRTDSVIIPADPAHGAIIDAQQTETTSSAKRAATRAAAAPPMPNQAEVGITSVEDSTAESESESEMDSGSGILSDSEFDGLNDNDEPTDADLNQIGGAYAAVNVDEPSHDGNDDDDMTF